jgi:hypothetical protein
MDTLDIVFCIWMSGMFFFIIAVVLFAYTQDDRILAFCVVLDFAVIALWVTMVVLVAARPTLAG